MPVHIIYERVRVKISHTLINSNCDQYLNGENKMNFVSVKIDWYQSTLLFYIAIVMICYLSPVLFNRVILKGTVKRKKGSSLWFLMVSFTLLFVKCFNTTGRDIRNGYYKNFLSATSFEEYSDQTVEIGFRTLQVIVRQFSDNYGVFLFLLGLITVVPFLYVVNKYKKRIDVPTAILFYACVYYYSGLSVARIAAAASFSFFVFDALVEKKKAKAFIFILVASSFHVTALILIIPYLMVLFKRLDKKMLCVGSALILCIAVLSRDSIYSFMNGSERYYIYKISDGSEIGFAQFAYYVPLVLLYLIGRKNHQDIEFGRIMDRIAVSFIGTAFSFGILSYFIPIFGRLYVMFAPLTIVTGYYINNIKSGVHRKYYKYLISALVLLYCFIRFGIYITEYYNLDDIMPYTNVFGWKI